jgi:hypothetical protein
MKEALLELLRNYEGTDVIVTDDMLNLVETCFDTAASNSTTTKAVVVIEGGIVTSVLVNDQAMEVAVIDHDTDGTDPTELTVIPNIGSVYAYIGDVVEFAPNRVADIFEEISAQGPIEGRD